MERDFGEKRRAKCGVCTIERGGAWVKALPAFKFFKVRCTKIVWGSEGGLRGELEVGPWQGSWVSRPRPPSSCSGLGARGSVNTPHRCPPHRCPSTAPFPHHCLPRPFPRTPCPALTAAPSPLPPPLTAACCLGRQGGCGAGDGLQEEAPGGGSGQAGLGVGLRLCRGAAAS